MYRLLLLLALASLGFAPVPFPRPDVGKADLARMQGEWLLSVALDRNGRENVARTSIWRIEGDQLTTSLDGKIGSVLYLTLDARTMPRSIDLRAKRGSTTFTPGLYRVAGDTLVVSVGPTRPRDLTGDAPSNGVWVFRRVKR